MASTFKVMLLAAYLRQDSVEDRNLTDGERNLLGPMIRESNNSNATQVRDMLGRGPVESLASAAGMAGFQWNDIWGYCRAEPKDGARLMRRLPGLLPEPASRLRPAPAREHHPPPALGCRPRPAEGVGPRLQGRVGPPRLPRRAPDGASSPRQAEHRRLGPDSGKPLAPVRPPDTRGRIQAPPEGPAEVRARRRAASRSRRRCSSPSHPPPPRASA